MRRAGRLLVVVFLITASFVCALKGGGANWARQLGKLVQRIEAIDPPLPLVGKKG
jgi:hypothetical protein